jgi:hypothetical protein
MTASPHNNTVFRAGTAIAKESRQEVTMSKTLGGMMVFGFALLAGCAGAGGSFTQRGTMLVDNGSAHAFVQGPAVVHAFSQDGGGKVFAAAATTGTDADCAGAAGDATAPSLSADSVKVVTLSPGQVACIATSGRRPYELLWKAQASEPAPAQLALASARR